MSQQSTEPDSPESDTTTDPRYYVNPAGHVAKLSELLYKAYRRNINFELHDDDTLTYGDTTYEPVD